VLLLLLATAALAGPPPERMLRDGREVSEGFLVGAVTLAYRVYKGGVSIGDGSRCAFEPSCSTFAHEAIRRRGPGGFVLTFDRLQRDSGAEGYPLSDDGYHRLDPVDDHYPPLALLSGVTCRRQRRAGAAACF